MSTLIPTIIALDFSAALAIFAILLRDIIDRQKANRDLIEGIHQTLFIHDRMADHHEHMDAVADGALHQKLDTLLDGLAKTLQDHQRLQAAVHEDGKLTRERIAQTKTRLADEESQDQQQKAHDRYEKSKQQRPKK